MVLAGRSGSARAAAAGGGLGPLPACAASEAGLDGRALEDHRGRVAQQITLGLFPGAAECVLAPDRVAYLDTQGCTDLSAQTPVNSKTLFRCFSMTKPVTAVAAMRLVEMGKIALDDPVAKYIPSFAKCRVVRKEARDDSAVDAEHLEPLRRPPTLRHLLTHTSGLAYGPDRYVASEKLKSKNADEESYAALSQAVDDGRVRSLARFCDQLAALPLRFQPGTEYLYSHGVDVVGRVIEVVSGMRLDVFLEVHVFGPLGMAHTSFSVPRGRIGVLATMYKAAKVARATRAGRAWASGARGADPFGVSLQRIDGARPQDSNWCGKQGILAGGGMIGTLPRGGLLSCLQDMALFCNMLMKGGQTLSGDAYLTRRTVSSLWCDWLQLRCVRAERRPGSPITMPGWSNGPSVGWSPLGHVRRRDGCLFMGGWSTSWAIYPKWQLATLVLHQSLIWFTVPAWCERRDELDGVVEAAKRRRGRARVGRGGTARKAQATQGAKDTRGARGAAASRRPLAARMGRRTRAAEAGARKDVARKRRAAPRAAALAWRPSKRARG